mmetsp:Transcript_118747/g.209969  ORF Transcript_118747/g.209969 Transcript_118747/m.209969 type:complete len:92 (+) Transcript_118747:1445-1720(+)
MPCKKAHIAYAKPMANGAVGGIQPNAEAADDFKHIQITPWVPAWNIVISARIACRVKPTNKDHITIAIIIAPGIAQANRSTRPEGLIDFKC